MAAVDPSPRTWILKFKIHKTTILLHADPSQSIAALKPELLRALNETHPTGKISGTLRSHSIPTSTNEIALGRLRDINDLSAGWEEIDSGEDGTGQDPNGKGKGKATANKPKSVRNGTSATLQSIGLRDGEILAVRFVSTEETTRLGAELKQDDEKDLEEYAGGNALQEEDEALKWDVVAPGPPDVGTEDDEEMPGIDGDFLHGRSVRDLTP